MPRMRVSIAGILVWVALLGVGFAALRNPSLLWSNALFSVALGTLTLAVLAAVYRRGRSRAYWVGFATCGWVYLLLALGPANESLVSPYLVTTAILDVLFEQVIPQPPAPGAPPPTVIPPVPTASAVKGQTWGGNVAVMPAVFGGFGGVAAAPFESPWHAWSTPDRELNMNPSPNLGGISVFSPEPFRRIGHSLFCLLIALLGGLVTRYFHATRDDRD
jgi:hypothetical protein